MATATSPVPDDRSTKRQKADENGNSSQGGDNLYPPRPPQHPGQMYPPGYMGGHGPYMGGPGMPPYGQYGNPHGPPPHYGGMYGGGPPPPPQIRGHGTPERNGRPGGPWGAYGRAGPSSGGPGKKDDAAMSNAPHPQQHPSNQPPYPVGGWGHPQSWQPAHPYGPPPPGYPGGHPSMQGMYSQGAPGPGRGGWPPAAGGSGGGASVGGGAGGVDGTSPSEQSSSRRTPAPGPSSSSVSPKSPTRNRHRPDSATPPEPMPPQQARNGNSVYCLEINSVQGGRMSVTQDFGEEGSSVSGSTKDKGRGSYKCGRCGVPKKGHICPYQPKLKRRPDEPPPETRNAAVQVEMDEFMTLRRLNIRIQGFPESYATEPYMVGNMVGAEPHIHDAYLPPGPPPIDAGTEMPMDDIYNNNHNMVNHSRHSPREDAGTPESVENTRTEAPLPTSSGSPLPDTEKMETGDEVEGDPTEKEEKQAMV